MKQIKNRFDIIVTLNPANMDHNILRAFLSKGATIFRLNGSFLNSEGIEKMVSCIRNICGNSVDILLDLPGFKPRFSYLKEKVIYEQGKPVKISLESINYPDIIRHMKKGDSLRINDGMVRLTIDSIDSENAIFVPDGSGVLHRGKGFHLENTGYRPVAHCLSEQDLSLIKTAKANNVDYVGISFVHNIKDIEMVKKELKGSATSFIPKIEARESYKLSNLVQLLVESKIIIMDRGDTAGELGLESIWLQQRRVINLAKVLQCRVIMATQFFTNMIKSPLPSIAEIDSLYDLVNYGIDGVQYSEETCIGEYALEAVSIIISSLPKIKRDEKPRGKVIWIMGPTSSGKTTIANELTRNLKKSNIPVFHIDGDEIRNLFNTNLSFQSKDRLRVVSAIIHFAKKGVENGQNVVVSALTANDDARSKVINTFPKDDLCIVYLDCSVKECEKRDPKGLYKKAKNGDIDTLIGYNVEYKPPEAYDLNIETNTLSPKESVAKILEYVISKKKLRYCY